MMKVFILFDYEHRVGNHFKGIFTSRELAQSYADKQIANGIWFDEVVIEEHKVKESDND